MAIIKGGSPLGELSGKMGGLVFSRNKGGAYVRQYVIPVNPNTVAQVNARAAFGSSAANWHNFNANEKARWQNYAEGIFSPLLQPNMGQFSGINAFTSLSNVVANANIRNLGINPLAFGSYSIETDTVPTINVTNETNYAVPDIPPSEFNTGVLQALGGVDQVALTIKNASINEVGNWNVTFSFNLVNTETIGPSPTTFNLGEMGLINSAGNEVGISCFMSESISQLGDFVRNPFYINLGTTAPITFTDVAIEGEDLTIRAQPSLDRYEYQKFPSVGDIVRLTFVMVDKFGQRKLIGADQSSIKIAP
jgi:hypothetical protein